MNDTKMTGITIEKLEDALNDIGEFIASDDYFEEKFWEMNDIYTKMQAAYLDETKDKSYAERILMDDFFALTEGETGSEPDNERYVEIVGEYVNMFARNGFLYMLDNEADWARTEGYGDAWWVKLIEKKKAEMAA